MLRLCVLQFIAGALMVAASSTLAQPNFPPAPPCTPSDAQICGQQSPEDVVRFDDDWVIASAMAGSGGVVMIDTAERSARTVYPAANAQHDYDAKNWPDCPGPPQADAFTTHGLYIEPGNAAHRRLFVVGHGARESIEIFDVDVSADEPSLTWIGCVIAPDPIGLNSVRGLPDGGFITTNFLPRDSSPEQTQAMLGGATNGELWEWHAESGWSEVPGSEASGANGLELSADGQEIYVAAWGSQSFFRLSRGWNPPVREEIDLGFRVDNIHWADDGSLYAVGQAETDWVIVSINPETLATQRILAQTDTEDFAGGTAAVQIDDELWIGSYRGNRIAVMPAP